MTRYETGAHKIPKQVALLAQALEREQGHLETIKALQEQNAQLRVEVGDLKGRLERIERPARVVSTGQQG